MWGVGEGDWFFVDEDDLLSLSKKARILRVSVPAVERWYNNLRLPVTKFELNSTRFRLSGQ